MTRFKNKYLPLTKNVDGLLKEKYLLNACKNQKQFLLAFRGSVEKYLLFLLKLHLAREGDALALARADIDGGAAVVEDIEGVEIGVLVVLHVDLDMAQAALRLRLLVVADGSREVQGVAATVGHAIGAAEIRQVGDQRVVAHIDGIAVRDCFAGASRGIHPVDRDLIVPLLQGSLHGLCLFCRPRSPLLCRGATCQHHPHRQCHHRCHKNLPHIIHVLSANIRKFWETNKEILINAFKNQKRFLSLKVKFNNKININ